MLKLKFLAMAAGLAALAQPQLAAAQSCISDEEVSAAAIYAVPPLIAGVRAKCRPVLADDGFLATNGDALSARYAALAPQNWPIARDALLKLAGTSSANERQIADTLRQLPDDAVRPMVDALIVEKLAEDIRPESCERIERGISLLEPLEPAETGAIAAFILLMVRPEGLPLCSAPVP